METRSSSSPPDSYVDSALGLRMFFFAAALAFVAGLSLRLYFHPGRVKNLLERTVAADQARIGLKFQSAKLSLARGAIPQLAIEVGGIELNPAHECRAEPSVRVAKLFLPLNFRRLLRFELAFGTVVGEDVEVDLDALKSRCAGKSQTAAASGTARAPATDAPAAASKAEPAAEAAKVAPWWSEEQATALHKRVQGFEFSRVTVLFEEATKKVYLESVALEAGPKAGSLGLAAKVVVPPELTYNERLPILKIDALASPTSADVNVRAALDEGNLSVKGHLSAAPGGFLDADLRASVGNVPLSTLVPLLVKAGVAGEGFRPRFMWMNCQASIRGRFQGLFVENPLTLSDCAIVGKGAKVQIGEAVRRPDGVWQPFVVKLGNLDLAQIVDAFDWRGLDGVVSEYGRFDGEAKFRGSDAFELSGDVQGARVHFLNRNERADQLIKRLHAHVEARDGRLNGLIDQMDLEQGQFDGKLAFEAFDRGREGTIRAELKSLRLNEGVQKVLLAGRLEEIAGAFSGRFVGRQLIQGTGRFQFRGVDGKDIRFSEANLKVESAGQGAELRVQMRAPRVEIRKESRFFRGLAAMFFSHEFTGDWINLEEPRMQGRVLTSANADFDNGSASWLRWEGVQTTLENRRIRLSSSGGMNRRNEIEGWVGADYPSLRRLKWQLSGQIEKPELRADSRNLSELREKGSIDDITLGLAAKSSGRE